MSVYCIECASLLEENERLRASHKELVAALEECEFVGHDTGMYCPSCGVRDGHSRVEKCKLESALAKAKEIGA